MFDQHQDSTPILARATLNSMAAAEHQALWLIRDMGHFVTRSLATSALTLSQHDLKMAYSAAVAMIERDEMEELGRLLSDLPNLIDFLPDTEDGLSLLHIAARQGSPNSIALLVEHGALLEQGCGTSQSPEEGPLPGWTPLLIAARNRREDNALELLDWGADPAHADPINGDTPLHCAASLGMERLARRLILTDAPLNAQATWSSFDDELGHYTGNTPLHVAALGNQLDMAWLLIKAGAERDLAKDDLRSPLFYAAARGHTDVVEVLLASGANPNAREASTVGKITTDLTPLHYAVLNGHTHTVAMLLCYGANPTLVESNSRATALDMARRNDDAPIVALLNTAIKRDFTEEVFSGMDGQTITWQRRHYVEMTPFLENLLTECPVNSRGLLVLSDWLAEVLGAENRVHLARVYRALPGDRKQMEK
ncbi:ankyrin repeat domain-containing protein [Uliginosibacterium gangwonense]|uniref:ankyrin repeat domain-containing protein n=1 Tax=Uliginosibacterium gangwonense TaxID=392736 RepID=UPI0003673A28|nr:ankyrin repeat domain-containing protein [Uliginosibacterium gangwonense]